MKRNVAYIKIAVCTQDPHIGKQIREYAAGFEIKLLSTGEKDSAPGILWYHLSWEKTVGYWQLYLSFQYPYDRQGNHILPSGLEPADTGPDTEHRTDIASSSAIAERRIPKRTLPRAQPSGTGASLSFFYRTGGERTYSVSWYQIYSKKWQFRGHWYHEKIIQDPCYNDRYGAGAYRDPGEIYQSSQRLSGQQPLPVLVLESGSRPDGRNPHTGEPDL